MGQQPYFSTVERLEAIIAALPDDVMLNLKAPTGRPGYGPQVLFRAYVATFILNSSSISAALRHIADDPQLSRVIGGAPTKYAISRFIAKLKDTDLLQRVMESVSAALTEMLPDLGTTVAIDSSDIKAWSSYKRTDPDAQSSRKKGTDGRMKWWYGFKLHMVSDADHEIPLGAYVTPANVSDMHQVGPSLELLPTPPTYVLADAGYGSAANRAIVESYHAIPVIKSHPRHKVPQPTNPIYSKRSSIERIFGRAKDFRRLNRLTMKGLGKAAVHCVTSVLSMMLWALAALLLGSDHLIRCMI